MEEPLLLIPGDPCQKGQLVFFGPHGLDRGSADRVLAIQRGWPPSGAPGLTSVPLIVVAGARVPPCDVTGVSSAAAGVAFGASFRAQLSPWVYPRMRWGHLRPHSSGNASCLLPRTWVGLQGPSPGLGCMHG